MLPEALAVAMVLSLNAYVLLGGADFGGGVWDLFAAGPRRDRQRALIASAIGPIWEANHVWLILVVVLLFTCFPAAFGIFSTALHIPLAAMLVGIVLRGSAFTFRAYDSGPSSVQRRWGLIFAIASVLTPVLLGVCVGAIAGGGVGSSVLAWPEGCDPLGAAARESCLREVAASGRSGNPGFVALFVSPWLSAFPLGAGALALCLFALLAAAYLTVEADDDALREDFRRRALLAALAVFVAAFGTLVLAGLDAPRIWAALTATPWALGLHLLTGASAFAAIWALVVRRFRVARIAVAAQASFILWGWALAQFPFMIPPVATIDQLAAPEVTLRLALWALAAGSLVLLPSLYYLFRIFKGSPTAFERVDGTRPSRPAP